MNCRKCGNILNQGDMVCRICGEPVQAMNGGVPGGAMPTPMPTPTPMPGVAPQVQQPVMTPTPSQPVITPEMANSGMGMGQTIAPGQPQPMNMGQPMMQQPMNGGANMGAPKNNKTFIILIVALLVVIIGLGGFVAVKFIGGDKEETKQSENDNRTNRNEPEESEDEEDPEEDPEDPVVSEGNYFEYAGYKFTIPNDVKYQTSEDTLMVSDSTTYRVALSVDKSISFDIVKTAPAEVAEAIASEGFVVKDYEFKTYNGIEYFVMNVDVEGQACKLFYAPLDEASSVMGIIVVKSEAGYDKAFEVSSKIIKTGTATSSFAPGTNTTPSYKVTEGMKNILKEEVPVTTGE